VVHEGRVEVGSRVRCRSIGCTSFAKVAVLALKILVVAQILTNLFDFVLLDLLQDGGSVDGPDVLVGLRSAASAGVVHRRYARSYRRYFGLQVHRLLLQNPVRLIGQGQLTGLPRFTLKRDRAFR